ncbi:hypothetical protein DSO57_1010267 [Entomophthora muscae]|uniref:Uncharacterized protein n=1 Tax=Entomophthora muscae TaxID=34485 RepID=A0ACC2SJC4_9FUNG|nr:hypothetical protein DSO57_1010267 [Entomophthora muscae]
MELLSYSQAGSCQSMMLVGNLVLSGSKVVYHQRLHVTSDKLLLTMLNEKPQLQDSNPDILQAASPQIFGFEPEQDLTSENPLRLDESKSPTLTLPTLNVPVNSTNQRAGLAIDPKITWATMKGETKKIPIECGPPRDDQSHDLIRKLEYLSLNQPMK